jgi:hypothetical protein
LLLKMGWMSEANEGSSLTPDGLSGAVEELQAIPARRQYQDQGRPRREPVTKWFSRVQLPS